uniref:homeodomain-interacting protein kinase 1-like n=1 Tax=Doryrhamphus excisus TaxID=161450 RepID=UPI0025ADC734|nr:homeodomain-interacting protein kinase 1-like [Doryrhamphus excisus]
MTQKASVSLNLKEILPHRYKTLKVLGKGSYGVVIECLDRKSRENMAIKIARPGKTVQREASILQLLMDIRLDRDNIVKFYGRSSSDRYLVFEMLDINLSQYYKAHGRMRLQDIRLVIQQLASAFDALKIVGVIHGDVKLDNIMLVDRGKQPFTVKLIDFSVALSRAEAKKVKMRQVAYFRAPEIILRLRYFEAIDIWSLGVVIVKMVLGIFPFMRSTDYDLLECMIGVLGLPPDNILKAGKTTRQFFNKTDLGQWIFKTRKEYSVESNDTISSKIYSLEEMRKVGSSKISSFVKLNAIDCPSIPKPDSRWNQMFPERDNEVDDFFKLLNAMFKWDQKKRITPSRILRHPFIRGSYLYNSPKLGLTQGPNQTSKRTCRKKKCTMKHVHKGCRCAVGSPHNIVDKHPFKTKKMHCIKRLFCWMKDKLLLEDAVGHMVPNIQSLTS